MNEPNKEKTYTATGLAAEAERKRRGDRRDGALLRNLDSMHVIVPMLYPNRCDNEAYISERIELAPIEDWIQKKNRALDEAYEAQKAAGENPLSPFRYTLFHVITIAMLKTVELRPKMNRFIANKNFYQRNYLSASFVVKKEFADDGAEALAILYAEAGDTADSLHEKLRKQVQECRSDKIDSSTESMDIISKLPRWMTRLVTWTCCKLDKHGKVPKSFVASDPYYSTILLSNLGSIRLKCGYHHLTNWGTNSVFCIIGETKNGTVDLGLTIDERLADGYYYSKTIRLLKTLLAQPELLEKPLDTPVDYE